MARFFVVLILCVMVSGCDDQTLFSNVAQRDANEMMAVLERAGISSTITPGAEPGRVTISVPAGDAATASQILARVGLPRPEQVPLSDMLPKESWMSSRSQEDARLAYGMGQDLSATLTQINGVRDARVHVALAQKNTIGQIETQPSASVLVRYDTSMLGPEFRDDIAALVSNAVPGLTYDRVSVTMVPDRGDMAFEMSAPKPAAAERSSRQTDFLGPSSFVWRLAIALLLGLALAWFLWSRIAGRAR